MQKPPFSILLPNTICLGNYYLFRKNLPLDATSYAYASVDILRKSIYNRNLNQLYDVLFWYRYLFSETDVMGNLRLDNMVQRGTEHLIKVKGQVSLKFDRIPNVEVEEEVEKLDTIEPESLSFLTRSLDEFM